MPIGARAYATHWQDWVNFALGGWLFISPWLLNYAGMPAAAWNSWIFGVVVAALSAAALIQFTRWSEWINVAVGVWLVVSPWVLAFAGAGSSRPVFNHIIVGLIVAILALWDALAHRRSEGGVAWD